MTHEWQSWVVAVLVTAAVSVAAASCGWWARRYRWIFPSLLAAAALAGCACLTWPSDLWASNALVLATGGAVGIFIGRFQRSVVALVTFALAAAVADAISISHGLTRWLFVAKLRSGTSALRYLAICAPSGGHLLAVVGGGDILLGVAIATAMTGLGYRLRGVLMVVPAGLMAAVIAGLVWGPVPGIPFLAVAVAVFVLANPIRSKGQG